MINPVSSGIGLYTLHKYRKLLESTVPLDAHGNPIVDEEEEETDGADREETIRLTLRDEEEEESGRGHGDGRAEGSGKPVRTV